MNVKTIRNYLGVLQIGALIMLVGTLFYMDYMFTISVNSSVSYAYFRGLYVLLFGSVGIIFCFVAVYYLFSQSYIKAFGANTIGTTIIWGVYLVVLLQFFGDLNRSLEWTPVSGTLNYAMLKGAYGANILASILSVVAMVMLSLLSIGYVLLFREKSPSNVDVDIKKKRRADTVYCSACGSEIKDESNKFCPNCGSKL
jgi:hypothetical protein